MGRVIYNDMIRNYPYLEPDIENWVASGIGTITVTMKDGRRLKYNMFSKEFVKIFNLDETGFPNSNEWKLSFSVSLINQLILKGIDQKDLAEMTGISNGMITNYCLGYSLPSVYNLSKIIHALECTYEDLVDFEE